MSFLEKKYNPWSLNWIIQRSCIVLKERRLPQLRLKKRPGLSGRKKKPCPTKSGKKVLSLQMMEIIIKEEQRSNLINTYFDRIYLLNLKYRSDKRLHSVYQMQEMGINAVIVDGTDGYKSPHLDEYEKYSQIPLYQPDAHPLEFKLKRKCISSPGAWGVLKSKKLILEDAIRNNYKRILILQDDLIFIHDFHRRFEEFVREAGDDWKILALGSTQHRWDIPEYLFYTDPEIKAYDPAQKYYHPKVTDGAFAIGVDQSVFQLLLDKIAPMNCSFDSGPMRAVYQAYPYKCFVCQPCLIIADVSTSDIREGRNQEEFSAKMKWDLALYDRKKYSELVSVIMPAFDAEQTIEKSIRSVLLQTHRNLELIVVDDGSTDDTGAIVRRLAGEDERIRYVRNDENRGCYFVRNDALRLAKGKYIAIQDADDISLKTRIEKQLIPLVSGNAMVSFSLFLRSRCMPEELDLDHQDAMMELVEKRRLKENGKYQYRDRPGLALATSLYKREMFEKYGLFWESRFGADGEFLERILFYETGKLFTDDHENAHSYISRTKSLPGIFALLDELLYISPEMDETNLTRQFEIRGPERTEFTRVCRERLLGKNDYQYPMF